MGAQRGGADLTDAKDKALRALIDTIEATGGIVRDPYRGLPVLVADEDWIDLADAYISACEAMGVEPKYQEEG